MNSKMGLDFNRLAMRQNGEMMATFYGVESFYDTATKSFLALAIMGNHSGAAIALKQDQLMALQMGCQFARDDSRITPQRAALVQQEDMVALQATHALLTVEHENKLLLGGKAVPTPAASRMPDDAREAAAKLIGRYTRATLQA